MVLYSLNNSSRSTKDKGYVECYYCKKMNHIALNYIFLANKVIKWKIKENPHATNVSIIEDPLTYENGDYLIEEMTLCEF